MHRWSRSGGWPRTFGTSRSTCRTPAPKSCRSLAAASTTGTTSSGPSDSSTGTSSSAAPYGWPACWCTRGPACEDGPTLASDPSRRSLAPTPRSAHADRQHQHPRRPRRRRPHLRPRRRLVLPRPVRQTVDGGSRAHARETRRDEAQGSNPGVRRLRVVLSGDGLRDGATRLVHEFDEPGARVVARVPLLARVRRHGRPHGERVLGEADRRLGARRGLSTLVSRPHGRAALGVALSWSPPPPPPPPLPPVPRSSPARRGWSAVTCYACCSRIRRTRVSRSSPVASCRSHTGSWTSAWWASITWPRSPISRACTTYSAASARP